MNKRQRKKTNKRTHRGQYAQFGFSISGHFDPPVDSDEWIDLFIATAERLNLMCGGGCSQTAFSFVVSRQEGNTTDKDAYELDMWLQTLPFVHDRKIVPLDLWHMPVDQCDPDRV